MWTESDFGVFSRVLELFPLLLSTTKICVAAAHKNFTQCSFSTFRLVCRLTHEAPELNLARDLCNNLQRTVDKKCSDSLLEPLQNIEINMHPAVLISCNLKQPLRRQRCGYWWNKNKVNWTTERRSKKWRGIAETDVWCRRNASCL